MRLIIILLFICQIGFGQNAWWQSISAGGNIPNKSQAVINLDGIKIRGTDTLWTDLTGKHDTVKIIGCDWWGDSEKSYKIIPYRTKAVVTFPVGLKPYDVDSFMFDGNGTPRQIPIISFFQNIDYANKIFCKEITQRLSDSIEVYGAGVRYFTVYSQAQTGANLTACKTFFNTPYEAVTNVKWIDPINGNDTWNGAKTRTSGSIGPWKTLAKGESSATLGDTIYIKTGNFNETNYWYPRSNKTWIFTGYSVVRSTGTTYTVSSQLPATAYMQGCIIDGKTTTDYVFAVEAGNSNFKKIKIINPKAVDNSNMVALVGGNPTFTNCVFIGNITRGVIYTASGYVIRINNSYIGCPVAVKSGGGALVLNYDKVNVTTTGFVVSMGAFNSGFVMRHSTMTGGSATTVINIVSTTGTPYIYLYGNTVNLTNVTQAFINSATDVASTITINNNNITCGGAGPFVQSTKNTSYYVNNNVINLTGNASALDLRKNTGTIHTKVFVINNAISQHLSTNYCIMVGQESTGVGDNTIDSIIISKNKLYGKYYYYDTATISSHGITIGYQTNCNRISYNYCNGHHFAEALKGSGGNFTNTYSWGNIYEHNLHYGFVLAGAQNSKIFNNTLKNNAIEFIFYANSGAATGHNLKNNIIYNQGGICYQFGSTSYTDHSIDTTCVYFTGILTQKNYETTPANLNWSQWQSDGFDTHSLNQDPVFVSATQLWPSTPLTGAVLSSPYNTILGISTNWGSSNQVPSIATFTNSSGQKGAYGQ